MSLFAVTNRRGASTAETAAAAQPESIARRTRRAVVLSGWLALILGQALGMLAANPTLLTDRLPFALDPVAVTLAGFALAGMLIGAVAGLALRGASTGLRLAVALFGMLIALIVFDVVLGLLRGLTLAAALMDVEDGVKLAQVGLGILGTSIGILAGRTPKPRVVTTGTAAQAAAPRASRRAASAQPAARSASRSGSSRQSAQARGSGRSQSRGSRGQAAARATRQTTGHGRRRATGRAAAASAPASGSSVSVSSIRTGVTSKESKPAKRKKTLFGRHKKVHLGKEQSAMCPYCLEEVRPNDPRGKVVCRICGAPHHADCWAITGKCEVPHLQT